MTEGGGISGFELAIAATLVGWLVIRWRSTSQHRTDVWLEAEGVVLDDRRRARIHRHIQVVTLLRTAVWVCGLGAALFVAPKHSTVAIVGVCVGYVAVTVASEAIPIMRQGGGASRRSSAAALLRRRRLRDVLSEDVILTAAGARLHLFASIAVALATLGSAGAIDAFPIVMRPLIVAVVVGLLCLAIATWMSRWPHFARDDEQLIVGELRRAAAINAVVGTALISILVGGARTVDAAVQQWWSNRDHGPPLWSTAPSLVLVLIGAVAPFVIVRITGAWTPISSSRLRSVLRSLGRARA